MSVTSGRPHNAADELLAELTDAAYRVALRHGLKGSFLETELELWGELGHILRRQGWSGIGANKPLAPAEGEPDGSLRGSAFVNLV